MSSIDVANSIPELETILDNGNEASSILMFTPPQWVLSRLRQGSDLDFEVRTHITKSRVASVVDAVRNLILDWSLTMEKAGVLGDGLIFSNEEKQHAIPAGQQFYIGNVGTLGNVSGHATVVNIQSAPKEIDLPALKQLLQDIRECLPSARDSLQTSLTPVLDALDAETISPKPNQSRIGELLRSAKSIAENAAGGVIGTGIAALLGQFLQ